MARKPEKTDQILEAATEELLAKGFDAASMHNIAERASISKRTLYKYFPTKDDLYVALTDALLDRVMEAQPHYRSDISLALQLRGIVEHKISLFTSETFLNMSKIVLGEMLKSRKPSDVQLERMYCAELAFIHWIDDAKKDNKVVDDVDSEVIANQFLSILKGQIFYPVLFYFVDPNEIQHENVIQSTVDFFMDRFTNQSET